MAQASAGSVGSARTMSHESAEPSVTRTPSTRAISAPAFGPWTILRRNFMGGSRIPMLKG